jgi:LPXTG-site transpeptidase (sortase) family protein
MVITKAVAPRQARVGESFTFRINVANNGSTSVSNLHVVDVFPSVLDLTSVTTTVGTGTLNTGARSIDVNLGNLAPGAEARITVIARVNTSATAIASQENQATMTWTGGSLESNNIRFRVLPSATLPGTGWAPRVVAAGLYAEAAKASPLARLLIGIVLLGGLGLAFLGMLLLGYSVYVRARHPLRAGTYTRAGLALVVLGLFAGLTGIVMIGLLPAAPRADLGMLAGEKPPLATQQAAEQSAVRPTRTPRPTPTVDYAMYLPTPTPESLPDYPVPAPTIVITEGPKGIEPDGSEVTRIVIPNMGLDTVVKFVPFDGQTWMIGGLKQEIAWMGDTSWPGLGSNTGLAGHVDLANGDAGPFWNLSSLKPGDEVTVYTQKNRYVYTVSEEKVVSDADMTILEPTNDAVITMITCTGWDPELQTYLQRLVVNARLLEVRPLGG